MQSFGHIAVSNSDLLVDDVASCKAEAYLDLPIHPHLVFITAAESGHLQAGLLWLAIL